MKSLMSLILAASVVFLLMHFLSGCSLMASQPAAVGSKPEGLQQVTLADIDSAIGIATAGKDPIGVACFTALKEYMSLTSETAAPTGPISMFAEIRVRRRQMQVGLPDNLQMGCAPVVFDANMTIARIAVIVSSKGLLR